MGTKPFQFVVIEYMACFFCDSYGSSEEIFEHQAQTHSEQQIKVIVTGTDGLCAICYYDGNELFEHFENEHSDLKLQHFNAITLNDDKLNWLLQLDHRNLCEPNQANASKPLETIDYNRIDYLICSCESNVSRDRIYVNHILSHDFDFHCSTCPFETQDLVELIQHDQSSHGLKSVNFRYLQFAERMRELYLNTKVVFKNGFVVDMRKLSKTKYDISQKFDELIEVMVEQMKEKYNQSIEIEPKEEEESVQSDDDCATKQREVNDTDSTASAGSNRHLLDERMAELHRQSEIINHIYVHGIPYKNGENLHALILKICDAIGANVEAKDIDKTYRPSKKKPIIIASFTEHETKLYVLECYSKMTTLWLDRLIQTSRKVPVLIDWFTTPYFQELIKKARSAHRNHDIYSYQWTKHGLFVRRHRSSKGKHVLNADELSDYMK